MSNQLIKTLIGSESSHLSKFMPTINLNLSALIFFPIKFTNKDEAPKDQQIICSLVPKGATPNKAYPNELFPDIMIACWTTNSKTKTAQKKLCSGTGGMADLNWNRLLNTFF